MEYTDVIENRIEESKELARSIKNEEVKLNKTVLSINYYTSSMTVVCSSLDSEGYDGIRFRKYTRSGIRYDYSNGDSNPQSKNQSMGLNRKR